MAKEERKPEEEKEAKKNPVFWEKLDRWITALTAIPVLGIVLKRTFEVFLEKGSEKLQKKVESFLGTLEEAEKDPTDEILYDSAVYSLGDEKKCEEMDAFVQKLRKKNPKKAEAFVLYIAKAIKLFERDVVETLTPEKGKKEPKVEQRYKNADAGIAEAKKLFEVILKVKGSTEEETFKKRVAFLEGKGIFLIIKKKKEAHPAIKKAGKAVKTFATDKAAEVVQAETNNRQNLSQLAAGWRDRSKNWRTKN